RADDDLAPDKGDDEPTVGQRRDVGHLRQARCDGGNVEIGRRSLAWRDNQKRQAGRDRRAPGTGHWGGRRHAGSLLRRGCTRKQRTRRMPRVSHPNGFVPPYARAAIERRLSQNATPENNNPRTAKDAAPQRLNLDNLSPLSSFRLARRARAATL